MRISRRTTAAVPAPPEWITGDAWVDVVTTSDDAPGAGIDSVRFAPGARTVWHRHPLGQVLIVTEGTGLVQRRGGSVETIRVGDTVHIAPGDWHWHGATPTTGMTHLAIERTPDDGSTAEAGEAVSDGEYLSHQHTLEVEHVDPAVAPITRSVVLDQRLAAPQSTHRVEVRRITIASGHAGGLHIHNGPVFGSIETGSAVYQIEGERASVLRPGDVFYEPEDVRIARFDAQDEGVTFLGYFLLADDETPQIEFPVD